MPQFKRELSREKKSYSGSAKKLKADSTTDELYKGHGIQGTTKKRNVEAPPMGVRGLPKMGSDLQGQLNCDHRKPNHPESGKKIPRNQRRNIEHGDFDGKENVIN